MQYEERHHSTDHESGHYRTSLTIKYTATTECITLYYDTMYSRTSTTAEPTYFGGMISSGYGAQHAKSRNPGNAKSGKVEDHNRVTSKKHNLSNIEIWLEEITNFLTQQSEHDHRLIANILEVTRRKVITLK